MNPPQLRDFRAELRVQLSEGGPSALIDLLRKHINDPDSHSIANEAMRLLGEQGDPSWPIQLAEVILDTSEEAVVFSGLHFHLENYFREDRDNVRTRIMAKIREGFSSSSKTRRVRAARIVNSLGYCDPSFQEELRVVLKATSLEGVERSQVLLATANLRVISAEQVQLEITELLDELVPFGQPMLSLVAQWGSDKHLPFLRKRLRDAESRDVLHAMLGIMRRYPDSSEEIALDFLHSDRTVQFGLEHYVCRYSDSPAILREFFERAKSAILERSARLIDIGLLKKCIRPKQLEMLQMFETMLLPDEKDSLRSAIVDPTGATGVYETSGTYVKKNTLALCSRLGLSGLKDWVVEAIPHETAPFMIHRLAVDSAFWDAGDFAPLLVHKMDQNSQESPMWLIADEAGVCGGIDTVRALLASDGRVPGGEASLNAYSLGLAYASVNSGSTVLLSQTMLDTSQPSWRREAAAFAIRQVSLLNASCEIDWSAVASYISLLSESEFARHELLISLAISEPEKARNLIVSMDEIERTKSRVMFSQVLCHCEVDSVLKFFEKYSTPALKPSRPSFETSYAAMCLARLYEDGNIDSSLVSFYLKKGLKDEIGTFSRSSRLVRQEDSELLEVIIVATLEQNDSWRSYPSFWQNLARLHPNAMLEDVTATHLYTCGDAAIYGYLNALLYHKELFVVHAKTIWQILSNLCTTKGRAVQWYSAYVASELCPELSANTILTSGASDDKARRSSLEHALWLSEDVWKKACAEAQDALWLQIGEYAVQLGDLRNELGWADSYWETVSSTENLFLTWKYTQALVHLPSERVITRAESMHADSIKLSFWQRWLVNKIENNLKSQREKLWKDSQLPGEEPFPRSPYSLNSAD